MLFYLLNYNLIVGFYLHSAIMKEVSHHERGHLVDKKNLNLCYFVWIYLFTSIYIEIILLKY